MNLFLKIKNQTSLCKCVYMTDRIIPDFIFFLLLVHTYKISFKLFCKKKTIKTKFVRGEKNGEGTRKRMDKKQRK